MFLKNLWNAIQYKEPGKNNYLILKGLTETLKLTISATIISIFIGLCFGIYLYMLKLNKNYWNQKIYFFINFLFNFLISPPFLPLSILIIKCFLGKFFNLYFGFKSAFICLSLVLTPLFARNCEQVFLELDSHLYETSYVLGANKSQFIRYFLLKEAQASILLKTISLFVSSLAYGSVLGALGAGGLGDIVYEYGVHSSFSFGEKFTSTDIIIVCVLINFILVEIIFYIGHKIAHQINKK
ncbi:ABC transporter permease subunit [Candidatus Phytoplasma phoenicium]|uniref:Methionine ABC transporter permease protein n=1 Tax=Candidatus Phytoplasma phoenicium TaxID=198422 RepID=A0A0L0MK43_9MOLU|nr:ABC transporter permease subunit [Candidatus Phytoplasma phoenicium]KND62665.1 Methionine ABC transporter permease protein [Candidatus Phytoplasma phoenicium]